ncbi:hypothetical protein PNOK_0559500 [Pyrrhoderma noxium]|uniref:Uncharacterized protein n=1 Tax=Pyrrhoderma noxium TaxID=2282107 RepID=A0A286UGK7_9AGAM|nr:hypothetical protein PNOK_0559500 [Pyrrhoderma noxium]
MHRYVSLLLLLLNLYDYLTLSRAPSLPLLLATYCLLLACLLVYLPDCLSDRPSVRSGWLIVSGLRTQDREPRTEDRRLKAGH